MLYPHNITNTSITIIVSVIGIWNRFFSTRPIVSGPAVEPPANIVRLIPIPIVTAPIIAERGNASGTLTLEPDRGRCKVKLEIDTKKNAYKVYEGYAVISSAVNNIHCTLRSEKIGEYCYIIFRHFHLNFAKQDCHMAAILSTSSAGSSRERYPAVLRMFLSREEIKEEHYKFLAPHLWLNYSQITISEEGLLNLRDISDEYSEIVDDLFNKTESKLMYLFKEKDVVSLAKEHLEGADVVKFITELRLQSYAYHYNKVSDTVENTVRNLLLSLGYYTDSVEREEGQGNLY